LESLLSQAIEELAARVGLAAVEAENELVEVVVEVLVGNGSLVGAQQPALEQGDHAMNPRQ